MSRYEHGRVLAVNETTLGSELVGDHAQGVGSLTVEDPVDFDEDGGWLSINGQVAEYSTYDDDTGEITLVGTLATAAGEGDRVDLWDELRQVVTVDKIAQVELDGDDDNTDPLEAVIPLHLLDDLAEGIRGIRGESVLLEQDGDEWRIVDVLGLAAPGGSGVQFWDADVLVTQSAGAQTATLTYEPVPRSVHVRRNRLPLEPIEYTVAGKTVTIPDAGAEIVAGDRIWFMYAYRKPVVSPTSPATPNPQTAAYVRHQATATQANYETTTTLTLTSEVPADHLLVISAAHLTAANATNITRAAGEGASWKPLKVHNTGATSAALWALRTTVTWPAGTAVTVTWSAGSRTKVCHLEEFQGVTTLLRGSGSAYFATGTAESTLDIQAQTGDLVVGAAANESTAFTTDNGDTDTAGGRPWLWGAVAVASTGLNASSTGGAVQYKVPAAAGPQSFSAGYGGRDNTSVIVALIPIGDPLDTETPT